jgi:hypothetical protein
MRARSKHALLNFGSGRTSSASIAVDGFCPPHRCRNAELDHVSCGRILRRWEMLAQDDAAPIARGLATEQQVSAAELAPSVAQAGRVVTFDRRHRW